jgi:hypothetical protein
MIDFCSLDSNNWIKLKEDCIENDTRQNNHSKLFNSSGL